MGTRRVVADALRLTRLVRKDPGLALLRADLGPMAAAILAEHLGGEVRRRPVAELHELVDEDLAALRDAGVAASRAGRAYCDQWRRAGVLVRATTPGSRRETYELSAPAEAAIRFLVRSGRPRPVATQSRLDTISTQVSRLARDSDPTATGRLEALRAERDALDAEIARVEAGDFVPLDGPEAAERLAEILALAEQVPGDFTRIRNEIAALNRSLREHVVSLDATRGDVLDDIFRGVDRIESSETGRSFLGFHELLDEDGDAGGQPAAAHGHEDTIEVGVLLDELQTDGALTGDDAGVVEGGDVGVALDLGQAGGLGLGGVEVVAVEADLAAQGADGVNLDLGGDGGHDDDGTHPQQGGGAGHALGVVAGRCGDDTALALGRAQGAHGIVGAADLEGVDRLKVLALDLDGVAQAGRQGGHLLEGRVLGRLVDGGLEDLPQVVGVVPGRGSVAADAVELIHR